MDATDATEYMDITAATELSGKIAPLLAEFLVDHPDDWLLAVHVLHGLGGSLLEMHGRPDWGDVDDDDPDDHEDST